jgi:hypothetical protein
LETHFTILKLSNQSKPERNLQDMLNLLKAKGSGESKVLEAVSLMHNQATAV